MLHNKIIFISAQPDTPYFHWQVEVQLHNFFKMGINPNWIEVLWSYSDQPSYKLIELAKKYPMVRFFFYKKRISDNYGYIPILRPDILEQHFRIYQNLRGEVIFYHDSDIIFREIPDFEAMFHDHIWYVSDTRSYIGSEYIRSKSEDLFLDLCSLANIEPDLVISNEPNSGGAQYLMKGVTFEFWKDVKETALKLYRYMADRELQERTNLQNTGKDLKNYNPIQKWCADMWAVLWCAWKSGAQTRIVPELEFSWGTSDLKTYNQFKIMHNAGVTSELRDRLFYKGDFISVSPFETNFDYINQNTASYKYVEAILYAKANSKKLT